jgi:GNAT superfamily N-acetyltransferase
MAKIVEANLPVTMVRDHLDDIPTYPLPAPYQARWYRPGDEAAWLNIQAEADHHNTITPELFNRSFGPDPQLLAGRQCYLLDETGAPIGTATAWLYDNYKDPSYGRIHWVAIIPEKQGLGLAKPLMSLVCQRLKELGHRRAYLTTSTIRLPALNLYLSFGFVPEISTPDDRQVWRELAPHLKYAYQR